MLLFVIAVLLHSCGPAELGPESYIAYCNDKSGELIQERDFNDIRYILKCEPVEYKALQELQNTGTPDHSEFEKLKKEYEGLVYFVFKMESLGSAKSPVKQLIKSHEDLSRMNQYCQSRLESDFYVESNGSKVPCAIFHMEEDHNMMNFNLISFAFDITKIDKEKDFTVVFDDPFFNRGTIKFNFSKNLFTRLPKLKLS